MNGTFDTGTMLIIFALGLVVGFFINKFASGSAKDNHALRQKLDELKNEHRDYQDNVNAHFMKTTHLIEKMNHNYKEIQAHVMQGAELLVSPDYVLENGDEFEVLEEPNKDDAFAPPKDWAPKNPDDSGTLSEHFGFQHKADPANTTESETADKK